MIPYFELKTIPVLGSDSFTFFLFFAFVFGYIYFLIRGRQGGYSVRKLTEFACFTTLPSLYGAHLFHLLAYRPSTLIYKPEALFQVTSGLASFGGILSFPIFFLIYLYCTGQLRLWADYLDFQVQGFIVGLGVGRIGCAVTHDHPGIPSDFFLAVQYPLGTRHDLGLYECIYLFVVVLPLSVYLHRAKAKAGMQFVLFSVVYGPFRFLAEYLREGDVRYVSLTPAQYGSITLIVVGLCLYYSKILFEKDRRCVNQT